MGDFNPFWSPEKELAYTEAAILASRAGSEVNLTSRSIFRGLSSDEARDYVRGLPHGHDESPGQTFFEDLFSEDIITYDKETRRYGVGVIGAALLSAWMEERAGNA